MNELYKFEKLDRKLTELGYPITNANSSFQIIKDIDFEKAYRAGSISFGKDGIYLEYNGTKYRGYMHLAESYYDRFNHHPKFHLTKCKTIQEFISLGIFKQRYIWSNSNKVDLIDDTTGEKYKNVVLDLCYNCQREIFNKYSNTQDFFDSLDKAVIKQKIVEVDIFGYDRKWQKISKAYRQSKNYTCEDCGIKPVNNIDKRFWHTHHKDGDKTNNDLSNLECLCILCHSYKDSTHEENFDKKRMKIELDSFVKHYQEKLRDVNNPYLKLYSIFNIS